MISGVLRLDAYVRVSKVAGRAGESFISPTVQRERIEAWAGLHGAELTWHEPELHVIGGGERRFFTGSWSGSALAGAGEWWWRSSTGSS
jgi:hypothetical protein